ncbi:hypothetical protein [Croceiramulus getboli]|nr:hypothetical protein P8624_12695 [Flavobacteriaceae bacterium YJPT1-3]
MNLNDQYKANKGGFKVPESYFDQLEQEVLDRWELESGLPESSGFGLPENYFDQLVPKVPEIRKPSPKVRLLKSPTLLWLAATAAVIALLIAVVLPTRTQALASPDLASIEAYLLDYPSLYEIDELTDQVDMTNLSYELPGSINDSLLLDLIEYEIDTYELPLDHY